MLIVVKVGVPGLGSSAKQEAADRGMATSSAPGMNAPEAAKAPPAAQGNTTQDSSSATGTDQGKAASNPADSGHGFATAQGQVGAPATGGPGANAFATASAEPAARTVALAMPPEARMGIAASPKTIAPGADAKMSMLAAPMASNVAVSSASSDGAVVTLSQTAIEDQDPDGATRWTRPVERFGPAANMAVALDGSVAVADGDNRLQILNSRGEQERLLYGTAPIERLRWSADGRVASREGSLVFVYGPSSDKPEFYVDAGAGADMAFAPDGTLAVLGDRADEPGVLVLADRKGAVVAEARTGTGGHGVAWSGDGSVVVAAGHAYDRQGHEVWHTSIVTDGVAPLGSSLITAWDARTVLILDARDGHVIWQAAWDGEGNGIRRVVTSPDGKHLAVSAAIGEGGAVWVLDADGNVVLSDRTPELPVDLAVSGNRLVIMLPDTLTVRDLPQ